MQITAAQLKRDSSSDPDRLALGTLVLDGELVIRNVRLIQQEDGKTVHVPTVRDHDRFLNSIEILSDDLRRRMTEQLVYLYESMNRSA